MKIDQNICNSCFGDKGIDLKDNCYNGLGMTDTQVDNVIGYLADIKYIYRLVDNNKIKACFINEDLVSEFENTDIFLIVVDDPAYSFFTLYNYLAKKKKSIELTKIHCSAKIHKSAVIFDTGVSIGKDCIIGANTVVESGVEIGYNVVIGNNCTVGCDDVEARNTTHGIIRVEHDGKLIIKDNVYIGSNSIIVRGLYSKDTIIEKDVTIANKSYIGHCNIIGNNSMILGAHICGSCIIGKNVRINPNSVVSNGVSLGDNSEISIGAVVIKDVDEYKKVSGNFAYDHLLMLRNYGKISRK